MKTRNVFGHIYKQKNSRFFWIKYSCNGKAMYESTRSTDKQFARSLLIARKAAADRGAPVTAKMANFTFRDAAKDLENYYAANKLKSIDDVRRKIGLHLMPFFGRYRMSDIRIPLVRRFIAARQEAGAKNAEINRELAALRRMFSLAIEADILEQQPKIKLLNEDPAREGFFEADQFRAVHRHLPDPLKNLAAFYYETGWRRNEALALEWRHVNFTGRGTVRLDRTMTKNGEPRVLQMTKAIRTILTAQQAERDRLKKTQGTLVVWVFHRRGKQIRDFYTAWRTACRRAGVPGKLIHDCRRTAVRNYTIRDGLSDQAAMQRTGHLTRSVFERYKIRTEKDDIAAAEHLDRVASGETFSDSEEKAGA